MNKTDEMERIAKTLYVEIHPDEQTGKATVMRAWFGSIDPYQMEKELGAHGRKFTLYCECGWSGTHYEARERTYDSGAESRSRLAWRQGWHWHCPECDDVVWRYYNIIS